MPVTERPSRVVKEPVSSRYEWSVAPFVREAEPGNEKEAFFHFRIQVQKKARTLERPRASQSGDVGGAERLKDVTIKCQNAFFSSSNNIIGDIVCLA